jgi:hypothetical protein
MQPPGRADRHGEEGGGAGEPFDTGPGPSRAAFLLAYAGVVVAGLLGAALGYAFADSTCRGDCTTDVAIGALVGAVVAAVGVGVVAVLTLRAMAEWRRPR